MRAQSPLARRELTTLYRGKNTLFEKLEVPPARNGAYLHLVLGDPSLVKFSLELRYRNDTEHKTGHETWYETGQGTGHKIGRERLHIARTTRVPNSGEFFIDLAREAEGPLKAAVLHLPKAFSGGRTGDALPCAPGLGRASGTRPADTPSHRLPHAKCTGAGGRASQQAQLRRLSRDAALKVRCGKRAGRR